MITDPTAELLELARTFVEAKTAHDELLAIPFADRPDTAPARATMFAAYRDFAFARGLRLGDRLIVRNYVPSTEGGYGEVVRLNEKTATVRCFAAGAPEVYVPLGADDVRLDYNAAEADAYELVAAADGEELELPVVVIPCGGQKAPEAGTPEELYVGSYFRAMLAAARTLTSDDRVRVLSGKHGFVRLDQVLEPYEQRIDEPGAVAESELEDQVVDDELLADVAAGRIIGVILAGSAYSARAVEVLGADARLELPFEGSRGIGDHLARAKRITAGPCPELDLLGGSPCVKDVGHELPHEDAEGDTWEPNPDGGAHWHPGPAPTRKEVAAELLAAAKELESDRWLRARARFLSAVGYRVGDRAYLEGRGSAMLFAGEVVELLEESKLRFRLDSGETVVVDFVELLPITSELMVAAGEVLDMEPEGASS